VFWKATETQKKMRSQLHRVLPLAGKTEASCLTKGEGQALTKEIHDLEEGRSGEAQKYLSAVCDGT